MTFSLRAAVHSKLTTLAGPLKPWHWEASWIPSQHTAVRMLHWVSASAPQQYLAGERPRAEKLLLHQDLLLFRCKPLRRHGQGLGSLPRFAVLQSRRELCKSGFLGELQNQLGLNFRWIRILGCSERARASAGCQSAWGQLQAFQNREIDFAGLVLWFAVVGFVFSLSLRWTYENGCIAIKRIKLSFLSEQICFLRWTRCQWPDITPFLLSPAHSELHVFSGSLNV